MTMAFFIANHIPYDSLHTVGCTIGTIRIDTPSGILQICKDSEWKNVCARDWGNLDAAVACRQLGYDGKAIGCNMSGLC